MVNPMEIYDRIKNISPTNKAMLPASTSGIFSGRMPYAAGLAAVLIAVALASSGIPYVPPLLY